MKRKAAIIAGLLALPLVLVALAVSTANTPWGREQLSCWVAGATEGRVRLAGLEGRFPDALRVDHVEVSDENGIWLTLDDLTLDWSPTRLLAGTARVNRLTSERVIIDRLPLVSGEDTGNEGLPVAIELHALDIGRLELGPALAGTHMILGLQGGARLDSLEAGRVDLNVHRLDSLGNYRLQARFDGADIDAQFVATEPAGGLLASLARLPGLGALKLNASLNGPRDALATQLAVEAGALTVLAKGRLNLLQNQADLKVTAESPALQLSPELAWQGLSLNLQVQGPFAQPDANGYLRLDQLQAGGAHVGAVAANLQNVAGELRMHAEASGLVLPGPQPELLAAAPLVLDAQWKLTQSRRPLEFNLHHPLIQAEGRAETEDIVRGELTVRAPQLGPLVAVGGLDLQGQATLTLRASRKEAATELDVEGLLALTGGQSPWPALLGDKAGFKFSTRLDGLGVDIAQAQFDGHNVRLNASGKLGEAGAELDWKAELKELMALNPRLKGWLSAEGKITGPADRRGVSAELKGEFGSQDIPKGPVSAKLSVQGWPVDPSGTLSAKGTLDGSSLTLGVRLNREKDAGLGIAIDEATWKNARAQGHLKLAAKTYFPTGRIELRVALEDFSRLLGQPLSGTVNARLDTAQSGDRMQTSLKGEARNVGVVGGVRVGQALIDLNVDDPAGRPRVEGWLTLDGVEAAERKTRLRLDASGPVESLKLNLSGTFGQPADTGADFESLAILDGKKQTLIISSAQWGWKREHLNLLEPVRVIYADGVTLDRLRLGFRQGQLEVAGRIAPRLDVTLAARDVPADLAAQFSPGLAADGALEADARLTGTIAQPKGAINLKAVGLRLKQGPWRSLPPAHLTADLNLNGVAARLTSKLDLGTNTHLNLNGDVPLGSASPLDLQASGIADLKLLDPLLTPDGRRVRGGITLKAVVAGTYAEPKINGQLDLTNGELQDYGLGTHLTGVTALVHADGERVRVVRFQGKSGPGSLEASGGVDLKTPGLPLDFRLTAKHARPLDGDRLSANLDADLSLRGPARGALLASGRIQLNRVDINIPERLPATIAVLNVRKPDAPAPAAEVSANANIGLDLTIVAPDEIYLRGRGLDAELGGRIRMRGSIDHPQPEGRFEMRRGHFSLAGQDLNFKEGAVGFDGGSLTDPALKFIAETAASDATAILTVGGTARKPTISLSSRPELPQDEILSHLLFGHGTTTLSPFEMARIAGAVVSLTGISGDASNPLETVRRGLGLDRLTVGSDQKGSPSLQGGRYIAPGVYVGAKQGATGASTQGTVQIDVANGLKLEGSVGTGSPSGTSSGTGSVGVIYQFEY